MQIYHRVTLRGGRTEVVESALIDTGAELSLLPSRLAGWIGAWLTNYETTVVGVHGDGKTLPIVVSDLAFPQLNNVGGRFAFVVSESEGPLIVGMDILKPLGITIDTTNHQLGVKNEVWEAFKTLAGVGVLVVGGLKILAQLVDESY